MFFSSRIMVAGSGGEGGPSLDDFLCGNVTQVTIPDRMTSLRNNLFYGCTSIQKVILNGKVTSLGESCFSGCSSLKTIENMGSIRQFGYSALRGTAFREFEIPEGTDSIGSYLFGYCSELTRVVIPSTVTYIPTDLFEGCSKLSEVVMRSGITSIASYAFYGTGALQTLSLPDTLKSIGGYAFTSSGIAELTIPASTDIILYNAFSGASKLTRVTFENPNGWILASSSTATSGDPIDLSDPQQNAVYLRDTYRSKYFRRIA